MGVTCHVWSWKVRYRATTAKSGDHDSPSGYMKSHLVPLTYRNSSAIKALMFSQDGRRLGN